MAVAGAAEGVVSVAGLEGARGPQRLRVEWDGAGQSLGGQSAVGSLVGAQARVRLEAEGPIVLYAFGFD